MHSTSPAISNKEGAVIRQNDNIIASRGLQLVGEAVFTPWDFPRLWRLLPAYRQYLAISIRHWVISIPIAITSCSCIHVMRNTSPEHPKGGPVISACTFHEYCYNPSTTSIILSDVSIRATPSLPLPNISLIQISILHSSMAQILYVLPPLTFSTRGEGKPGDEARRYSVPKIVFMLHESRLHKQ